jgi:hypothetical protein
MIEAMAGRHRKQHALLAHGHRGRHRKPPSRQRAILPTIMVVALLAVGGVMFTHAVAQGQPPHAAIDAPRTPSIVPPVVTAPSSPATAPARPKAKHHHHHHRAHHRAAPALTVTDLGSPCYIQVTSHGHLLTRRILHAGQHVAFRQHDLHVVLGNAGAVKISLHGHHVRRGGRSGQVRAFRVR